MTYAIIWDMDGVIADTGEAHYRAWQAFFAERGETIDYEQFAATFGMANGPILRQWLGEHVTEAEIATLAARKETLFREQVKEHVRLLPGVRHWLEYARARGYRQVIASSGPMANIVAVVGALPIADFFDALLSGALLPRSKPDPAIFLHAAAAVGVPPSRSLVIEDSTAGIEAARRAGMRCLAITTTHPAARLTQADRVIDHLTDLEGDAFARLLGDDA